MSQSKDDLFIRNVPGSTEVLQKAVVGVAGCGGLGSNAAVGLVRAGVGKLILADFDVVEPSNLNRQQYFIDQLGQTKAEALEANLKRINPYVDYEAHCVRLTPDNIPTLFAEADVLVEAFDRADQKAMLLQSFTGKPIVAASGLAGHGSGETIGVRKMGDRIHIVGDLETGAAPGCGRAAGGDSPGRSRSQPPAGRRERRRGSCRPGHRGRPLPPARRAPRPASGRRARR